MSWKFDPYTGEPLDEGSMPSQEAKDYLDQHLARKARSNNSTWTITIVILIAVIAIAGITVAGINATKATGTQTSSLHSSHRVHKGNGHGSGVVPEDGKSPYIGDPSGHCIVPESNAGSNGDWKTPDQPSGSPRDVKDPRTDGIQHL